MFINAKPRSVSNGFEAFVPIHRVESLHQRLVEMTNNDINAWSVYRPVATSASDSWDQHIDDFGNENVSVQSPYGGYFPQASLAVPRQPVDYSKTSSFTHAHQTRCQPSKSSISEQPQSGSASEMNCIQKQSPMLGHDYSQWSLGRGRGSFVEFSRIRNVLKDFPCQAPIESNLATCTPISSTQNLQGSYQQETLTLGANFNMDRTSPSTAYSSYSPLTASADPMSLIADLDNGQISTAKTGWWPESLRDNRDRYPDSGGILWSYDGLPKCQTQQHQQYCNIWNTDAQGVDNWTAEAVTSSTISPKLLTLNVSSASSSSGSTQGGMAGLYESSTVASSSEDLSDHSGRETLTVVEPQPRAQRQGQILPDAGPRALAVVEQPRPQRQRQILPDSGLISRGVVPVLPSNDFTSNRNTKRATKVVKSGNNTRKKASPTPLSNSITKQTSSRRTEAATSRSSDPKRIEPKPASPTPQQSQATVAQASAMAQAIHHREAKDDFLIRSKLAGMSYKEIRRQGKFSEAESTLRGRFRTLTKHKNARVRKPEWDENDLRLLKKAVRKLAPGSDPTKSKVPWKQVAEYIANNGGSYHFGNATCRKRWDELQAKSGR